MFLSRDIRAETRGPTDDFWYRPITYRIGGPVSPEQAMFLTTVWACVRVLAETVGSTPLHMYRRLGRGKERVTDNPLATLVARRPNRWQTAMEWREMMQGHLALRGNAYSEIIYGPRGDITDLVPINPDAVRVQITDTGIPRYQVKDANGRERTLLWSEILHLRGMSATGYVGMSPIEYERASIGEALAAQDYGARFYENDAQSTRWIEMPGNFKTNDDAKIFKERWQAAQTGGGRWKTPVLEAGMKLHEVGIKHTDAQFLETRRYKDEDIARIFRMPPHKVGIMDRATFSNIEQQAIEFVTDTMLPWFVRWEQTLSMALIGPEERDDLFFEFNVNGLLRGDAKARSEFYGRGVQDGWMTRNEVRERENLNPLDGLDTPLEPLNMAPAGSQEPTGDDE